MIFKKLEIIEKEKKVKQIIKIMNMILKYQVLIFINYHGMINI